MIFVVQLPRGTARFDVVAVEHYQVSYLVCGGFLSCQIGVPAHLLLCFFQPLPGLLVHGVHPVSVYLAGWVKGFRRRWIHSRRVDVTLNRATPDDGIHQCRLLKGNNGGYVPLYIA